MQYLSGKKNTDADSMYRLNISSGDDTEKPTDVKVPVLAIEDDVNQPKLDEHEISIPHTDKVDKLKPAKRVSLDEMLEAQLEDYECQKYGATNVFRS